MADHNIQLRTLGGNKLYPITKSSVVINDGGFITESDIATNNKVGVVKPDGTTITIDANGKITAVGGGEGSSTLAGLTDVNLSEQKINQVLTYDGSKWVNADSLRQYKALPTASESYSERIVQYIGQTINGLVKGNIYECVKNSDNTYSWVELKITEDSLSDSLKSNLFKVTQTEDDILNFNSFL